MQSYQNLVLLQNLYRLKSLGFEYIDHFDINDKKSFEQPKDLDELKRNVQKCHLCDLSKSRTQSMSGFGSKNSPIVFVDYSISQSQDSTNNYFAGKSGETLQKMIENVLELSINEIYMTHAIKCKPLGTNKPSKSEWNSCKHYLFSELEFIRPKVIVTLGEDAYAHLSGDTHNFETVRGHVIDFKGARLIPIYHPQYLLRNPDSKKIALNDLKTIRGCL